MASADSSDWAVVREAAANRPAQIQIVVTGCAYSCCGRGWQRRDEYEQTYCGWVDNFQEPDGGAGTFMLYNPGLGTVSYVLAVRDFELVDACPI